MSIVQGAHCLGACEAPIGWGTVQGAHYQVTAQANRKAAEYQKTVAMASMLIDRIQSDAAYADLRNDANLGQLEVRKKELASSLTDLDHTILLGRVPELKQRMPEAELLVALTKFLTVDTSRLSDFVQTVLRRHAA